MKIPTNLTSLFLIIPHSEHTDKTPVICNNIEGFVRDWMPPNKGYVAAIQRVLQYEPPAPGKYQYSNNQKVGPYCFYPITEPLDDAMTPIASPKSTAQDARTLSQYLEILTPEQVTQALLLIESGTNESTTGIQAAIRYAQSCLEP